MLMFNQSKKELDNIYFIKCIESIKKGNSLLHTKKRNLLFIALGIILLAGSLAAYYRDLLPTGANTGKIIVIDAGHGGNDPGKIGLNDTLEKDINLQISKKLGAYLRGKGYTVIFTRTSDCMLGEAGAANKKTADMKERINIMNQEQADLVISIHQNSYPDQSIRGAQCFYYHLSEESMALAEYLQKALIKISDNNNRRQAKSNDNYYILKNTTCPAVIVECGFLSNPEEAELLTTDSYQKKIALSIATGIESYFNSLR